MNKNIAKYRKFPKKSLKENYSLNKPKIIIDKNCNINNIEKNQKKYRKQCILKDTINQIVAYEENLKVKKPEKYNALINDLIGKITKYYDCPKAHIDFNFFKKEMRSDNGDWLDCIGFKVGISSSKLFQGWVKCRYLDRKNVWYEGPFKDGKIHSDDLKLFHRTRPTVAIFEGTIKHGLKQGYGIIRNFENKVIYKGHFKNGQEDGSGIIIFDGNSIIRFEGSKMNGKNHGFCRAYDCHGSLLEEGVYNDGVRTGVFKCFRMNCNQYTEKVYDENGQDQQTEKTYERELYRNGAKYNNEYRLISFKLKNSQNYLYDCNYHTNGKLRSRRHFCINHASFFSTHFFENGKISKINYEDF